MACLYPGRSVPRRGHRRGAQRDRDRLRGPWPEHKGRFARLRESVRLMRELWQGDGVDFDGEFYQPRAPRSMTSPTAGARSTLRRADRSGEVCTAAPETDSSAPQAKAWSRHRQAHPVDDARAPRRRDAIPTTIDKMIEIKISPRPRPGVGAGEHPVLGAAVVDCRAEASIRHRWRRSRPPTRCRSSKSPSGGSWLRIARRGGGESGRLCRLRASTI